MQHTIENQETHYIHAKKISNKQETPYEIQETHYNFQEIAIQKTCENEKKQTNTKIKRMQHTKNEQT